MRWSYKTVHYELKKEGLLGSAFLDEAEVELSLNEYGMAEWELVSILETQDGIIAVFKQPLGVVRQAAGFSEEEADRPYVPLRPKRDDFRLEPDFSNDEHQVGRSESLVVPIDEYEIVVVKEDEEKKPTQSEDDVGSIVIE
ncbi:MAG: DUF4177 domain-containing protein [Proteobacteria bacterium]|nr:DUF4177 domain-containing protein [Pseudomonadota bacterium]